jgi:hypothetical protein
MADRDYTIVGPDGREVTIVGPANASPAQLKAAAQKAFGAQPAEQRKDLPFGMQTMANIGGGLVRGAGSIGATLLAPRDALESLMARKMGAPEMQVPDRRKAMDAALQGMGVDTDSLAFGGGKLTSEIAGTLGVGGGLANAAARVPGVAPGVVNAIRTAGMQAGTGGRASNALARVAGGALTGGAAAGLVNPEDAGTGAAIGGALPGVVSAAGKAGQLAMRPFRGNSGGADLARALDLNTPQQIDAAIAQLQAAKTLVPGAAPTAAQVLRTPQAGILQRVVSDSAGGGSLRDTLAAQNAARMAALERVAPTGSTGYASARQDLGEAVSRFANNADQAARGRTSELYQAVPQDEAMLYLPDLAAVRDKYFGPAVFTDRGAVDKAVSTAAQVGTEKVPAGIMPRAGQGPMTLAQAVRKAGGISIRDNDGLRGELAGLRGDLKNLVRANGGLTPGRMAEKMREAGYLADEDSATLLNALRDEATGNPVTSIYDDASRQWGASRDAAMGDAPDAATIPRKVSLKDFDDLRKSIGEEQRAAAQGGKATAAKALGDMKAALDDRINEVVRGDGAIDENLPLDWANKLSEARKAKLDQVQRFRTGPQAAIFRKGQDGQPVVQGGEVAAKFWGNRPGVADDVKAFRRLVDDNPQLLGQFRSMVTTEGASTQTAAGNLTSKFAKWVDNSLPGLKEAFEPEQVKMLRRIAADVKRAESAGAAGMSRGSNTYQNAQNALSLGLLDNPLMNAAANRIPVVNSVSGPAFTWMRDTAREAKARRLAALLGDSSAAAAALRSANSAGTRNALAAIFDKDLAPMLYRSAPVLAADR